MLWALIFSQKTNFRLFRTQRVCSDNFQFDENGSRMFSKWVENTVVKGEIARYEQFLLLPQCFQKDLLETCKNQGLFGKGLLFNKPLFSPASSTSLLKTLWERETLLVIITFSFPTVFSTLSENFLPFSWNFKLPSANSLCLEESKFPTMFSKGFFLRVVESPDCVKS